MGATFIEKLYTQAQQLGHSFESAIEKYLDLAKKYNIAPSTFANAFVINRPFVTSNIIGATSIKHLEENINSIDITLTEEMLKDIEDIHLSDPNPCV
mgnify:CR=1 FL=1